MPGTPVSVASARAGVFVDAPCGDRGVCGKCRVQVVGALSQPTGAERKTLSSDQLAAGWRLACQATIQGAATITVPIGTLQIAVDGLGREIVPRPNAHKLHISLPEADLANAESAVNRLRDTLAQPDLRIGIDALRQLALALPGSASITATIVGGECVNVEPGDTSDRCFGIAFDVGTTTVVGALVDLNTGRELAVSGTLNQQALHGADVITRVKLTLEDADGLRKLHALIIGVLNTLTDDLLAQTGVARADIAEVTIVGNTCMHHLVLGIAPASLGEAPYAAVVQEALTVRPADLALDLAPTARVYMLPVIAGHVGADTVGVVLATGLHQAEDIRLAVDIGTNGESVLGSRRGMVACSNAAGPAFEGTSIRHGMRATTGAIQGAQILDAKSGDIVLSVVGGRSAREATAPGGTAGYANGVGQEPASGARAVQPIGICGSGLIDIVAELRLAEIINENGRLAGAEDAPAGLSAALRARLIVVDGERAFRLAGFATPTSTGTDPATLGGGLATKAEPFVALTQRDIRELQLAKGAIFAGIQVLKRELGVADEDIAEIDLAGAFGSYIRPDSARTIGLIPNVPLDRVKSIGNAARVGARLALISTEARAEAEVIAREVVHQELFARSDFLDDFTEAMRFPIPPEPSLPPGPRLAD